MLYDHIYNKNFKNVLENKIQKIPPIWFMRQAGRYQNSYQNFRKKFDFITLCKEPKIAAQVALSPIIDFDFDIAILFSDILFPIEALGIDLKFNPSPEFNRKIELSDLNDKSEARIQKMLKFLNFQFNALKETRKVLPKEKSLVGFVGGIWTLFNFAIQENILKNDKNKILENQNYILLFQNFAELFLKLLNENIKLQLESGAEIVYIFDTDAGTLDNNLYLKYLAEDLFFLAKKFPKKLAYFTKTDQIDFFNKDCFNNNFWAGFVYDSRLNIKNALTNNLNNIFIQGNLDPLTLNLPEEEFKLILKNYLNEFKNLTEEQRAKWIFSLGHGVTPNAKEENVRYAVKYVREFFSL